MKEASINLVYLIGAFLCLANFYLSYIRYPIFRLLGKKEISIRIGIPANSISNPSNRFHFWTEREHDFDFDDSSCRNRHWGHSLVDWV
jgi:hypothetical protein